MPIKNSTFSFGKRCFSIRCLVKKCRGGKPIPPEREGMIHAIGFLILIALMVLVTYKDLVNLFR